MSKITLIVLAAVVAAAVRESSAVTNEATFIIESVNGDPGNTWTVCIAIPQLSSLNI